MTKCDFCSVIIPQERFTKYNRIAKYCSNRCNQRAYIVRHNITKSSHFREDTLDEWYKTNTGMARIYESLVANLVQGDLQPFGSHFDILRGEERIDVKVCNLYKRKKKRGKDVKDVQKQVGWWVFNRNKGETDVDYFICLGLVKNIPVKFYKIPSSIFKNGVTVSPVASKFDQYLIAV